MMCVQVTLVVEDFIMVIQYVLSGSTLAAVGVVLSFLVKTLKGTRAMLRADILDIYYRYNHDKIMPEYEYNSLVDLYAQYKALGGNGFITKVYNEIIEKWSVKDRG